ncbi:MAG: HesA/MoeB/ThiF family protein [Thermodesulfobacteriota bacterium]
MKKMNRFPPKLRAAVTESARKIQDPADRRVCIIDETSSRTIAGELDISLLQVHAAALASEIWPLRYLRNHDSLSVQDQLLLLQSRAAIIGAGGLGGHVMHLLARLGIGRLVAADDQKFDESNVNRQLFAQTDTLGAWKVDTAAAMVARINPAVVVEAHRDRVTEENVDHVIDGAHVVVDAIDNVGDRLLLQSACNRRQVPMVHGALAGFEGQVMTVFPGDEGLRTLYDSDTQGPSAPSAEATLGVPAIAPAFIATLQAMEVIKILLQRGRPLQQRMLYTELENSRFSEFCF